MEYPRRLEFDGELICTVSHATEPGGVRGAMADGTKLPSATTVEEVLMNGMIRWVANAPLHKNVHLVWEEETMLGKRQKAVDLPVHPASVDAPKTPPDAKKQCFSLTTAEIIERRKQAEIRICEELTALCKDTGMLLLAVDFIQQNERTGLISISIGI